MNDVLDDRQLIALDVLLAGGTQQDAADRAGVSRQTVNGWATSHRSFMAERQARRTLRAQRMADRFEAVVGDALDLVADKVNEGDLTAALTLVKMAGPAWFVHPVDEHDHHGTDIGAVLRERVRRLEESS